MKTRPSSALRAKKLPEVIVIDDSDEEGEIGTPSNSVAQRQVKVKVEGKEGESSDDGNGNEEEEEEETSSSSSSEDDGDGDEDSESEEEEPVVAKSVKRSSSSASVNSIVKKGRKEAGTGSGSIESFNVKRAVYIELDGSDASQLKPDHQNRPLWIGKDNRIYLEAFSLIVREAQDLLVAIAEPITRPKRIHEYKLTEYSLYAALSVGLDTAAILEGLEKLCKLPIPPKVEDFIRKSTKSYAKVKLILKDGGRYYVESRDEQVLKTLLQSDVIKDARLVPDMVVAAEEAENNEGAAGFIVGIEMTNQEFVVPTVKIPVKTAAPVKEEEVVLVQKVATAVVAPLPPPPDESLLQFFDEYEIDDQDEFKDLDPDLYYTEGKEDIANIEDPSSNQNIIIPNVSLPQNIIDLDEIEEEEVAPPVPENNIDDPGGVTDGHVVHSFEIKKSHINQVKKQSSALSYPMLEEYDFHGDHLNPALSIDLKPMAKLRPYQQKCLGKLFGNGRARSGIIVLPCGAGKTLVGVTAACTMKKSVLVLCNSSLSVEQWAREFKYWSTLPETDIGKFSSETKEKFKGVSGVLISTYTMIAYSGKRAYDAQKMMDFVQSMEWGLLLLDEVHVVPADMFQKTLTIVAAHTKLGLTATLVREDEKIHTLNWLIGPKLYEANWMELAASGYIANVQCAEVWCSMSGPFFREYLRATSRKKQLLYVMNPQKIQACQYLINTHEAMGDKIIVFSDNIFALKHYAERLGKPYIYGGTSQSERMRVLQQFRFNPALNTIFLSKVGDTSIDLPEATCLIQISSHYGSRRQEAQRLGRILRPKKGNKSKFTAFFYSLVSTDTEEMFYATKRQQFLIDQGYEFKIITNLGGGDDPDGNVLYGSLSDQLSLLNTVLLSSESDWIEEQVVDPDQATGGDDEDEDEEEEAQPVFTRRTGNTLSSLSGTDQMAYMEFSRGSSSGLARRVKSKKS